MPTEATMTPGLFTQLEALLENRAVLITVSALGGKGGRLQVNICPRQLKDGENTALTTPLSVTGTAAELDAELVNQVRGFVDSHNALSTNLSQIQAEIAEAEKAAREEAKKKRTVGNGGKKGGASKEMPEEKPETGQQPLSLFDAADSQPTESAG